MNFKTLLRFKKKEELPSTRKIGDRVVLNNTVLEENTAVGNDSHLYNVSLGEYSYIGQRGTMMNTKIGKFCSIGQGTSISLGMHPSSTFVSTSPVFFSPHKQCGTTFANGSYFKEMGNCTIGNDVWIGANVIIMDDVTVGDGAIIGAGAVVTQNIPPYAITVGIPSKVIKYRFTENEIEFLLKFKWWDRDINWIKENYKDFHDIKPFMKKYQNDNR